MAPAEWQSTKADCAFGGGRDHCRSGWQEQIQQPFFGVDLCFVGHILKLLFAYHVDGDLDQVANHRLDITPDISDLGEFRRFDLQEGRTCQLRQPPRDFRLSHAGRADHDDVFRHDFFGHLRRKLLPAHAISQGNGHGALGFMLPDDVLVQLDDNLPRSKLVKRQLLFFKSGWKVYSHELTPH